MHGVSARLSPQRAPRPVAQSHCAILESKAELDNRRMRQNWKLTLEYDGTRYHGWQEQQNARTIMGELRRAVEAYLGVPVELQGAGRTDAGVHALGQVAHCRFDAPRQPSPGEFIRAVNEKLPGDIALLAARPVDWEFHARHHALSRRYLYRYSLRKQAFLRRYVWWVKQPLDLVRMQWAARMIEGRHDFRLFRAEDPERPNESTIVVVNRCSVEREGDLILFRIEASHFLWRMVRRLAGVLARLGAGELDLEQFGLLLEGRNDLGLDVAAWTAPAAGLVLESVQYPPRYA